MNKYVLDAFSFGLVALFMTIVAIVVLIAGVESEAIALTFVTSGIAWIIYIAVILFRMRADKKAKENNE